MITSKDYPRVALEPLLSCDESVQQAIRVVRNEDSVRSGMYSSHEITTEEHSSWLRSLAGNPAQRVWSIMLDAKLVGAASLSRISPEHKTADWAFYVTTAMQGTGLGGVVEFLLVDHAFSSVGLAKLNCEVLATNRAVIRLHNKFGFVEEGVRRQNIVSGGQRVDVVLLGISADEWRASRNRVESLVKRVYRSL